MFKEAKLISGHQGERRREKERRKHRSSDCPTFTAAGLAKLLLASGLYA